MTQPTPETGGKRYCKPPKIPWYILVPFAIIVSATIAYIMSKDTVIEWKDKAKENIRDERGKRVQKRKVAEKMMLSAAHDDGNVI